MHFKSDSPPRNTWPTSTINRWRRLWSRLREFNASQVELHERFLLLNRPWEEDYLHWAHDGVQWRLHGQWQPPDGHSPGPVTGGGWCLGRGDRGASRTLRTPR